MKILFLSRATLFTNAGGDTIQMKNTAAQLNELGVITEIRLANEQIDYESYDLIHFFNIIRPADILHHARKSGKPYLVSTIFVDYTEYERKVSKGIRKLIFRFLSLNAIEYLKVLARQMINSERILSYYYIFHGHKQSVKKVIANAALLLPNSHNEYKRLVGEYKIAKAYKVIPNGINPALFTLPADATNSKRPIVICVARIEPLKNQLNLIKALRNTEYKLFIIGHPSVNHQEYYEACKKEADGLVTFIDYIPQEELIQYYTLAKVHVLPSWFETTGLSSLEAAAMGCNIVVTEKGDTREYFKDYAYYCDPASPQSIFHAVKQAAQDPVNSELASMIVNHYTWKIAAMKTLAAYEEILSKQ